MSTRPEQPEKFLRGCLYPGFGDVPYPRINPAVIEQVPIDVWEAAQIPAGVRIEVMGDAEAVDISYRTSTTNFGYRGESAGCSFVAYRGTQKISEARAVLGEGVARLPLTGEPTRPAIIYLPEGMKPVVTSVMAIGGRLEPAPALPRWLAYGDAMTQGWMAPCPAMAWPSVAARKLGLDLVNLGFAGSARGETSMAVMMAEQPAEAISVAFGQSNWDRVPHTAELLGEETHVFLRILRLSHPNAPIVVMSPTLRPDAERSKNIIGVTLADLRASMEEAVGEMVAAGDTRLWLVQGDRVLSDSDLADGVYPNEEGHKRLAAGVSKYLNPLVAEMRAAMLARKQEEVLARAPGLTLSLNLDLAQPTAPSLPPPVPNVVPVVLPGDGSVGASSGGVVLSPPPTVARPPTISPPADSPTLPVSSETGQAVPDLPVAAALLPGAVNGQPVYVQVLDPVTGRVQLQEVPQGTQVPALARSVQPPLPPSPPALAPSPAPPQATVSTPAPDALVAVPRHPDVESDFLADEVGNDTEASVARNSGSGSAATPGGEDVDELEDVEQIGGESQQIGSAEGSGDEVGALSASTPERDWEVPVSRHVGGPVLLPSRAQMANPDPAVSHDRGARSDDEAGLEAAFDGGAEPVSQTVEPVSQTVEPPTPAEHPIGQEVVAVAPAVVAEIVDPEMARFMEQQQADSHALESVGMAISQVATAMMAAQSAVAQVAASVEDAVLGSAPGSDPPDQAVGATPGGTGAGREDQSSLPVGSSNSDLSSTQDPTPETPMDLPGVMVPVRQPPEAAPQPLEMVEMAISQVATAMQVAQSAVAQVAAAVEGAVMTHVASIAAQMEEADMMDLEAAGEVPIPVSAPAGQVSGSAAPVEPTPANL